MMKEKNAMVSVVLPCYNVEKYIKKSVTSILNQSYRNFELIIINDGSTDKTDRALTSFKDKRIRVVTHIRNRGLINSLNEGYKLARGVYLARMDADDISSSIRLEKQVEYLKTNPKVGVVGTWLNVFGEHNYIWKTHEKDKYIKAKLLFENPIAHPSIMMRKSEWINSNIKFEKQYPSAEDFMLWSKLAEKDVSFANIQEPLLEYRTHSEQIGSVKKKEQINSSWQVRKYNLYRLNIIPNSSEKEIHQKLSSWISFANPEEIKQAGNWLRKLDLANRHTKAFNVDALSKVIGERWLVSCYLSAPGIIRQIQYLLSQPLLLPLTFKIYLLRKLENLYV